MRSRAVHRRCGDGPPRDASTKSLLPAETSHGLTSAVVSDVVCAKSGSSVPRTRQATPLMLFVVTCSGRRPYLFSPYRTRASVFGFSGSGRSPMRVAGIEKSIALSAQ
jgi:hypothetical protein